MIKEKLCPRTGWNYNNSLTNLPTPAILVPYSIVLMLKSISNSKLIKSHLIQLASVLSDLTDNESGEFKTYIIDINR